MNKVFQIHLGTLVFTVEEQAYNRLNSYLEKLKIHFGTTEASNEIIADIESRMAELFQKKLSQTKTVLFDVDVEEVISIMGEAEQIHEGAGEPDSKSTFGGERPQNPKKLRRNPKDQVLGGVCSGIASFFDIDPVIVRILFAISIVVYGTGLLFYLILWLVIPEAAFDQSEFMDYQQKQRSKKLFRDPDKKAIGGVCAGLAAYFGLDVIWIRLAFLIMLFFFGSGALVYIILWIVISEAKTAAEKLQMKGEPVDIRNIEKEIKNAVKTNESSVRTVAEKIIKFFGLIIGAVFKLLAAVFILLIFALLFGLVLFLFGSGFGLGNMNMLSEISRMIFESQFMLYSVLVGVALIVFTPLLSILFALTKLLFGVKLKTKPIALTMGSLFMLGMILLIFASIKYSSENDTKYQFSTINGIDKSDTIFVMMPSTTTENFGEVWDGIVINGSHAQMTSEGLIWPINNFRILASESDSIFIRIKFKARGGNKAEAKQNANLINYSPSISANRITLFADYLINRHDKFKFQNVEPIIYVPVGKIIFLDNSSQKRLGSKATKRGQFYIMTNLGIKCIDCAETNIEDSEEDLIFENGNIKFKIESEGDGTEKGIHISFSNGKDGKENEPNDEN